MPEIDCTAIIPCRNEEHTISLVITDLQNHLGFSKNKIVVVDNGSSDKTREIAESMGVLVVSESSKGYGSACQAGLKIAPSSQWILIVDGDGSDFIEDGQNLWSQRNSAELLIGLRQPVEIGALQPIQRFGNWLTCNLLFLVFKQRFHDMGPFRFIRRVFLDHLSLQDKTWGWNIEMHYLALQSRGRVKEIPVRYRKRRGGTSKISGNFWSSIRVGTRILFTFAVLLFRKPIPPYTPK